MHFHFPTNEYKKYAYLLDQSLKLRKKAFSNKLGWKISVAGPLEKDKYDSLHPSHTIWCDKDRTEFYGSVRPMPMTDPTLLYHVFREIFPQAHDLVASSIREGTRIFFDNEVIKLVFSDIRAEKAFCVPLLALCEVALNNGIHTIISNDEP